MSNNVIHLNMMDSIVGLASKLTQRLATAGESLSYGDVLQAALEKAKAKPPAEMAPDEYKSYIEEKLQALPRNVTHCRDKETVVISDEGLAAMQADPEYEAWVINVVKENLATDTIGFLYNGHKCVHQFGATKADYRGTSWARQKNDSLMDLAAETKSYWELRREKIAAQQAITQELLAKRKLLKTLYEQEALQQIALAKATGRDEEMPEAYISGVPAALLLAGLAPGGGA